MCVCMHVCVHARVCAYTCACMCVRMCVCDCQGLPNWGLCCCCSDQVVDMRKDDLFIVKYSAVERLVAEGKVMLV